MTTLSPPRLALGQSLAIDLHHCELARIAQRQVVEDVMLRAAWESGATVVESHFHEFSPQGISGVVVITESHFAIHTWPEHHFAAVDVFTCGSKVDLHRATEVLKEGFGALSASVTHHLERGAIKPPPFTDQLSLAITVHGCRDTSALATQRLLSTVADLLGAPNAARHLAHRSFSLLCEQLNFTGRFTADRLDILAMGALVVAPPALATAAMRIFEGTTFSFHTTPIQ